jgi:hypothetical protein
MKVLKSLALKAQTLVQPQGRPTQINLVHFFDTVRKSFGKLIQSQVDGFELIIAKAQEAGVPNTWLAYMLATAWHETARTMRPITEYGPSLYLKRKKYWPYVGRGFVQLTWRANYEKYGIADHPERALEPALAAHIMIDGMTRGIFTGQKLEDYFNARRSDPVGARRIINGTDRAQQIAGYYRVFLIALEDGAPAVEVTAS